MMLAAQGSRITTQVPDSDDEAWMGEVGLGCWAYGNEIQAEPPGKAALCFHKPQLKIDKASRSSLRLTGKTVTLLKREEATLLLQTVVRGARLAHRGVTSAPRLGTGSILCCQRGLNLLHTAMP